MKFVVVGGGGYVGYHIAVDLVTKSHNVILYDLNEPDVEWVEDAGEISEFRKLSPELLRFQKGNVLDIQGLKDAFHGADCVIHAVSFGMSGREQMPAYWEKTELINITGTKNVIQACVFAKVSALVYTSTVNVVFGGQEIHNGDESLPYYPLVKHIDHYSRTKSVAEQLVLMADTKSGNQMRTMALRLAGVIGVKERRHLPRIIRMLPILKFTFGYGDSLVQFVGLENIVQAHVKAAMALLNKPQLVGGQSYFITDGPPINNFEYIRPIIETLGYPFPKLKIPMILMWFFTYTVQFMHMLLYPVWDFTPILAPAEIAKSGVTHYFNISKAKEHFGYEPIKPNDISEACQYYRLKMLKDSEVRKNSLSLVLGTKWILLFCIITVGIFVLTAH